MTAPVATATLDKPTYTPGDLVVLTIDHTDLDRATLAVAGTVTDSQGNSGSWSVEAVIDDGVVAITDDGGYAWATLSATRDRAVFTTTLPL